MENLPVDEPPELYGLHSNQEPTLATVESRQLQSSLYSIEFPVESQRWVSNSHVDTFLCRNASNYQSIELCLLHY